MNLPDSVEVKLEALLTREHIGKRLLWLLLDLGVSCTLREEVVLLESQVVFEVLDAKEVVVVIQKGGNVDLSLVAGFHALNRWHRLVLVTKVYALDVNCLTVSAVIFVKISLRIRVVRILPA